ncbi:coiled-coil domain-containing protein 137 isoform X1 [Meriones unguiculatus]|uniref:coiled-coil domain-containing protein 137 isoform X1 n=1 Tax=Meriones unguiculatus TaxID=10047 RepID=UPI00293EFB7C|nr:coiled-coil domain-containing protein 137 isoform X1 [Meriones unguiculatus]
MARQGRVSRASALSAGLGGSAQPQALRKQQSQGPSRPGQRSKEKKKVNCKPKNQDEQEIPFRLREIMRSRQEMKKPLSNKKRKKEGFLCVALAVLDSLCKPGWPGISKEQPASASQSAGITGVRHAWLEYTFLVPVLPSCTVVFLFAQVAFKKTLEREAKGEEPDLVVPMFRQRKGESDGAYIQRMEQEAQHVLFLSKNQASRQPEVQAAPGKKSERKKAFQKRRLEKAQKKREARAVERLEQELLKDPVKFGEVVLQPPELTVQPRRSTNRDTPGKKLLMLKMLLGPGGVSSTPATSLARQRILGEERERAVQAYRALKKLQRQEVTPGQPPSSSFQRTLQACL